MESWKQTVEIKPQHKQSNHLKAIYLQISRLQKAFSGIEPDNIVH